jgi:signal transduction histidine kinase
MEYQFAKTDMVRLVRDTFEGLRPLAVQKGLEFTLKVPDGELAVNADAQKLKQVFQNLIDNAIKYTPSGSVAVELYEAAGGAVMFAVRDTGLGFAPELAPHLFEEFVRDERVKKQILGTGLGLFIARKIIEAHGGKLWAESKGLQKGSAFFVALKKIL